MKIKYFAYPTPRDFLWKSYILLTHPLVISFENHSFGIQISFENSCTLKFYYKDVRQRPCTLKYFLQNTATKDARQGPCSLKFLNRILQRTMFDKGLVPLNCAPKDVRQRPCTLKCSTKYCNVRSSTRALYP